jgi:hypothetical protein
VDEQLFALPDEMTKVCTVCKEARPLDEFATRPGTTRKQSWCRTCKQAYDRDCTSATRSSTRRTSQ